MLKIHVLNAGKGDTIILESIEKSGSHFGIIDSCNIPQKNPSKLFQKLTELGAKDISFVALTHPHADHYTGMLEVLQAFSVEKFYSFPMNAFVNQAPSARLKSLMTAYADIHANTDVQSVRKNIEEFILILAHIRDKIGMDNWHEVNGLEETLYPTGFVGNTAFKAIFPLKKSKGEIFRILDGNPIEHVETPDMNKFSAAFVVEYRGHKIILGGDVVGDDWLEHWRQVKFANLNAGAAKLPHHAAKKDATNDVIDYIFGDDQSLPTIYSEKNELVKIALISAIGDKHHPSEAALTALSHKKILPYCTNLSIHCATSISPIVQAPELNPKLNAFISMNLDPSAPAVQPCQGDLCVTITDSGVASIDREFDTFCPYRDVI